MMPHSVATALTMAAALAAGTTPSAAAPSPPRVSVAIPIPLTPDRWTATDTIRFETYLGRPALYIDRGVALARDVELEDGVIEFSMAATARTSFLGVAFHALKPDYAEVVFFRVNESGTDEAVQYGPALNNLGAAWQVYHGPGANATAELARERWIPVRIVVRGDSASVYLDGGAAPALVVPRLAGAGGKRLGVWTGLFGRGAYFSEFSYTPAPKSAKAPAPPHPRGTIVDWRISPAFDATRLTPGKLPDLSRIVWQPVSVEPPGIVLLNRYRVAPRAALPFDTVTRIIDEVSVMGGRVRGSTVVLARTTIDADRAGMRRLHFGYSDGVVVYCNGQPLFFGMNAQFFRGDGIMSTVGDAVYLPLRQGRNEIVLAVTEYTGGWAYWARLDPE